MVLSPEDALSRSHRARARHMRTILLTFIQVSLTNTMFISPFLDVRLYYQSQAMPRCCVAAFAILTVEWVIRAVKPVPNGKEVLNLDDQKAFVIVRQMGGLNQTPFQQQYFLWILRSYPAETQAESVCNTPLMASRPRSIV